VNLILGIISLDIGCNHVFYEATDNLTEQRVQVLVPDQQKVVPERLELSAFALHDIPPEGEILVRRSNQLSYGTSCSYCGGCRCKWKLSRVMLSTQASYGICESDSLASATTTTTTSSGSVV
jgi:hypothetical protein